MPGDPQRKTDAKRMQPQESERGRLRVVKEAVKRVIKISLAPAREPFFLPSGWHSKKESADKDLKSAGKCRAACALRISKEPCIP